MEGRLLARFVGPLGMSWELRIVVDMELPEDTLSQGLALMRVEAALPAITALLQKLGPCSVSVPRVMDRRRGGRTRENYTQESIDKRRLAGK